MRNTARGLRPILDTEAWASFADVLIAAYGGVRRTAAECPGIPAPRLSDWRLGRRNAIGSKTRAAAERAIWGVGDERLKQQLRRLYRQALCAPAGQVETANPVSPVRWPLEAKPLEALASIASGLLRYVGNSPRGAEARFGIPRRTLLRWRGWRSPGRANGRGHRAGRPHGIISGENLKRVVRAVLSVPDGGGIGSQMRKTLQSIVPQRRARDFFREGEMFRVWRRVARTEVEAWRRAGSRVLLGPGANVGEAQVWAFRLRGNESLLELHNLGMEALHARLGGDPECRFDEPLEYPSAHTPADRLAFQGHLDRTTNRRGVGAITEAKSLAIIEAESPGYWGRHELNRQARENALRVRAGRVQAARALRWPLYDALRMEL